MVFIDKPTTAVISYRDGHVERSDFKNERQAHRYLTKARRFIFMSDFGSYLTYNATADLYFDI